VHQEGKQPLDLRLVGCEGENPYVTSSKIAIISHRHALSNHTPVQHRDLGKLKHKFKGSNDEWATVLSYFLLQQQPEIEHLHLLEGARLVYALKKNDLEISVRQDVQGIKVRHFA
jgi:hypothetical protein